MGALLGVMALGSVLIGVGADRVPAAQAAPASVEPALLLLMASQPTIAPAAVSLNHSSSLLAPSLAVAAMPALEPAASPMMCLASFTWTGNGGNTKWDTPGNWSYPSGGSPDDCADDATLPYTSGGWDIQLVTVQIDDLIVESSVDFPPAPSSSPAFKADRITLQGGNDITLKFENVTFKTFGCP